jgi:hypothetical protein
MGGSLGCYRAMDHIPRSPNVIKGPLLTGKLPGNLKNGGLGQKYRLGTVLWLLFLKSKML